MFALYAEPEIMKIRCPQCRAACVVDISKVPDQGIRARCPKCRSRFFLKKKWLPAENNHRSLHMIQPNRKPEDSIEPASGSDPRTILFRNYKAPENEARPEIVPPAPEPEADFFNPTVVPAKPVPPGIAAKFLGLFANDLAIDLGTANTLVYMKHWGIVLNESSVVAMRTGHDKENRVIAVGKEAREMLGRTPDNVLAIRPMRDGVIADFEAAGVMLRHFIKKVRRGFLKPRMLIAVPSGITPIERKAVKESAMQAGARSVHLIEEPMAAAIGADLPVDQPTCNMVVDIGGGTTEVAVISLSGIVAGRSVKVAGDKMDDAIIRYIRKKYNFIIGERTAEQVKIRIGNAMPDTDHPESIDVKGWEMVSGRPRIFRVNAVEVREAISEQLNAILDAVRLVLDRLPQELAESLIDNGMVLTGGVALLENLDRFITERIGISVKVADDPLGAIVVGSGKTLNNPELFQLVTG